MSQARTLQQLQSLDQQIREIQTRLREIDHILNNDEAIQAIQAHIEEAETTLKPLRTQAKDAELELESLTERVGEKETRLYSGAVKNPKEMQDIQQEVTALKAREDELEEAMLTLMMEVEEVEAALNDHQQSLKDTRKQRKAANEMLVIEHEQKTDKLNTLQQERQFIRNNLEPVHVKLYDQTVQRTRGQAVTHMNNDGTCSICGVQQTRSAETDIRRGNITQCSNCRRILIF